MIVQPTDIQPSIDGIMDINNTVNSGYNEPTVPGCLVRYIVNSLYNIPN